ncbi:hypothetical protein ABPG75_006455 [Micractinium tetrahymenae]
MAMLQACTAPCAPLRPLGIAGLGTSLKLHIAPHKHAMELRSLLGQARWQPAIKTVDASDSPCVSRSSSAKIPAASCSVDAEALLATPDTWPCLPTASLWPSVLAAPSTGAWARRPLPSIATPTAAAAISTSDSSTAGPSASAATNAACDCSSEAADRCTFAFPAGLGTSLKLHIAPREHALELRSLLGQADCQPASKCTGASIEALLAVPHTWPSLSPSMLSTAAPSTGFWARHLLLSTALPAADVAVSSSDLSATGSALSVSAAASEDCDCCSEAADVEPAVAPAEDAAVDDDAAAADVPAAPAAVAAAAVVVGAACAASPADCSSPSGPTAEPALACEPGDVTAPLCTFAFPAGLGTSLKLHIAPREHALELRSLLGQTDCQPATKHTGVNAEALLSTSPSWPCLPTASLWPSVLPGAARATGFWARRLLLSTATPACGAAVSTSDSSAAAPTALAADCSANAAGVAPADAAAGTAGAACGTGPSPLPAELSPGAELSPPAELYRIPARRWGAPEPTLACSSCSPSKLKSATTDAANTTPAAPYKVPLRRSREEQAAAEEAGRPGRLCPWPLLAAGPQLPAAAWPAAPQLSYLLAACRASC